MNILIGSNLLALIAIYVASFFGCEAQTNLPKEMPADIQMSYGSNGGMSPYFTKIVIEGEAIQFVEKMPQTNNKLVIWTAKISPEDKAALYKMFVDNKFDRITNEKNKSITYDAGSEGVSILFAPNVLYSVQSGANFPLSSANKERYQTVAAEFDRLAKKYEALREKPVEASLEDARKQAVAYFNTLNANTTQNTNAQPKTMYEAKFTPFFPTEWAAANQTKWVSYVYASGFDISVMDGEKTTKPFATITYNPLTQKATVEKISAKLESGDIQGVKPLPKEISSVLNTEKDVEKILLGTKNRSEISPKDAQKVISFYEYWMKYNYSMYHGIADNHVEFYQWVSDKDSKRLASSSSPSSKIAVINYDPANHGWIFKNGKAAILSNEEISEVQSIVATEIAAYNSNQTANISLDEYKLQLIPILDEKDQKKVWVNAFCSSEQKNWKTEIIAVDDGGKCYWHMFVNLSNKTGANLSVNGEA